MGNFGMAAHMERGEKKAGRHADLLSRAETTAIRCSRGTANGVDARIVRDLIDTLAQQEIELRQAIEDKRARPVSERL